MQFSNPQSEKILLALMVREPHDTISMLLEKCGEDAKAEKLFYDPKHQVAFRAIMDTFSDNPDNFNPANVLTRDNSQTMTDIMVLSSSGSTFDSEKILTECVTWLSIREVDQIQREYAEWRRNGVSVEGFREIAASNAARIREQFKFANRREKLSSEVFTEESEQPFPTGFKLFDERLKGGWRAGRVNLFAGHTKGGKTVLQANITAWQLLNGRPAFVIEREIGAQAYTNLVVSVLSGVEYERLDIKKDLVEDELDRIRQALDLMDSYMRIDDSLYTVPSIASWVGLKKEEFDNNPYTLVQIDHLGLLKPSDSKKIGNIGMAMEEITYELHDMAHSGHGLCVPIVLTAQLEDSAARILVAKGRLSRDQYMVRGSRAIEHAVDTAWSLGRDPKGASAAVIAKVIDRWGDGSDSEPTSIPYNHPIRSFIIDE